MSEVNLQNNKILKTHINPLASKGYSCVCSQSNPIYNYNGFVPTYQQPYYTANYRYQMPQVYSQYPVAQMTTNPQIAQKQQITPGATIDAGGTKCEIPPGTNGLNIIINNPTVATPGSHPMINTNTNCINGSGANGTTSGSGGSGNATATASASVEENNSKKKKNVVVLTDDYIKNLENYLRSPDKELKTFAMNEVSARFQDDEKRKNNPSLNALLNLGLQAKEPNVRFIALWLLKQGLAGGNDVTVQILNNMQQSKIYKGLEASDAKKALLKMSETVVKVPDNSPEISRKKKETKE